MPAWSNLSTWFENLRVSGQNIPVFDSTQGTTGNPKLFTCKWGHALIRVLYQVLLINLTKKNWNNSENSRLLVPPDFLK